MKERGIAGISEHGVFGLRAFDAQGSLIWEEEAVNSLMDQGEQDVLNVYFRGATPPAQFYFRLFNDTPVETDTLSDLTGEPTGNGYAAQLVERSTVGWPTLVMDAGDYQTTSKTVTFQAVGGSWGPVSHIVCATTSDNTGKFLSSAALQQSRTLAAGESLQVTYKIKLQ